MSVTVSGSRAAREVESAAGRVAGTPWARGLARLGFLTKAVVYVVIGALAGLLAAGAGGRTTDAKGAIATLAQAPWGRALVAMLALGLVGHGLWFLLEAAADPSRERGAWGAVVRIGKAIAGLGYGALAAWAAGVALGNGAGASGDAVARSWTARALALPAGRVLVIAGGIVAIVVGVRQIRRGWRCRSDPQVQTARMGPRLRRWAPRIGFAGLAAQGSIVLLVGVFFVQAALERDPREATGFDGALAWIARQPYGIALLAAAAVGLLAYAAWAAIEARYKPLPRSR